MRTIRRAELGMVGNGGQFAPTARRDVAVDVPETPAPARDIVAEADLQALAETVEASFDTDGRTIIAVQIDREQLPTSDFRVGSAPWEIEDEEVSDDQVDAYLESRSDDPEEFADAIGFDGEARWNSASHTLELTHTGFEGISDEEMSMSVSATLRDFRDDLRFHPWT